MLGQLKHILIDYGKVESFLSLKHKSFDLLSELSSNASSIANKATPFVYDRDPAYFTPVIPTWNHYLFINIGFHVIYAKIVAYQAPKIGWQPMVCNRRSPTDQQKPRLAIAPKQNRYYWRRWQPEDSRKTKRRVFCRTFDRRRAENLPTVSGRYAKDERHDRLYTEPSSALCHNCTSGEAVLLFYVVFSKY